MKIDANTLTVGQLVRALEAVHNAPKTRQLSRALEDSDVMRTTAHRAPFFDCSLDNQQIALHDGLISFQLEQQLGSFPFLNFRFRDEQNVKDLGLIFKSVSNPGHPNNIEVIVRDLTPHDTPLQNITSQTTLAELVSAIKVASLSAMNDQSFNAVEDTAVKFVRAVNAAIVASNEKLREERKARINGAFLPSVRDDLLDVIKMIEDSTGVIKVANDSFLSFWNLLDEPVMYPDYFYVNAALFVAHNVNPGNSNRNRFLDDFVVSKEFFNKEIMPKVKGIKPLMNVDLQKPIAVELLESVRNYYIELGQVPPIIATAA